MDGLIGLMGTPFWVLYTGSVLVCTWPGPSWSVGFYAENVCLCAPLCDPRLPDGPAGPTPWRDSRIPGSERPDSAVPRLNAEAEP